MAHGKWPKITAVVNDVGGGNEIDMEGLDAEAKKYVKTARVLLGHSLYSDSWLEL